MAIDDDSPSIIQLIDNAVPAPLAQFDAFPKLPSSYKARSDSRGFLTILIGLLSLLLMLNDIGEYIWGWPDYEFSVDNTQASFLGINIDMTVNMPCKFISVDLRDAVGDRLFLSGSLRRDGTKFDVGQATALREHAEALSAKQAVSQSRKSHGFFSTFMRRNPPKFKPTYNHEPDGSSCRIWGSLAVKRVTANLHVTTLGHGYSSYDHIDHEHMNFSHVISEFSFGPHFPEIVQPLDNSFETAEEHFIAYQYFLHIVPTTYVASHSDPLHTHQYSVTHYTRVLSHNQGTPGIFFKFDLDPLNITLHQRTTTFIQLIIRCVGVIGGTFVCMGYAIRITTRAVEVVSGADQTPGLVGAEASGAKLGFRAKWTGGELRARAKNGRMVRQGNMWVLEGNDPTYVGNGSPYLGLGNGTPQLGSTYSGSTPGTPNSSVGLRLPNSAYGLGPQANTLSNGPPVSPGMGYENFSLRPEPNSTSLVGLGPYLNSPNLGPFVPNVGTYFPQRNISRSPSPFPSANGNGHGNDGDIGKGNDVLSGPPPLKVQKDE